MQRCRGNDVNAARREVMWWRVWPTLAHASLLSQVLSFTKLLISEKRREDACALQSWRESERASPIDFARSALGARCVFASLLLLHSKAGAKQMKAETVLRSHSSSNALNFSRR